MNIADYLESHTTPVEQTVESIDRWAHLHMAQPQMLCGPYEGRLLTMLCRLVSPRCAVEVGSFIGYSTVCLAAGLPPEGHLHTFEINDEYEDAIRRHLSMAQCSDKVTLHVGDARQRIPELFPADKRTIDLAFIDADKRSLQRYYDLLVPRMRRGALLIVDNVLWGGKVLDLSHHNDIDTQTIHAFNEYVQHDSRVENIMLGVRDGLFIISVL